MLPPLPDVLARAHVIRLGMNVKFRGVTEREIVLFEGPQGWAEFAPFVEYDDDESASWLRGALEWGWGSDVPPVRTHVPVNATMPAVPAGRVESVLERFGDMGERPTVKVKVAERGQALVDDLARVCRVRDLLPTANIRVDANGGWLEPEAVDALSALADFGLEYAEQPVPDVEGLARVREALDARGVPLLIAADESVRKAEDPLRVARLGAADLLVVKAMPLGGVARALSIVKESGLPCVVSSALDSSVGIAAGVALAAALPELPYACGLATVALFAEDVADPSLLPQGGMIRVEDAMRVHSGDAVRQDLIERASVEGQREQWWLDRVALTYTNLLTTEA